MSRFPRKSREDSVWLLQISISIRCPAIRSDSIGCEFSVLIKIKTVHTIFIRNILVSGYHSIIRHIVPGVFMQKPSIMNRPILVKVVPCTINLFPLIRYHPAGRIHVVPFTVILLPCIFYRQTVFVILPFAESGFVKSVLNPCCPLDAFCFKNRFRWRCL